MNKWSDARKLRDTRLHDIHVLFHYHEARVAKGAFAPRWRGKKVFKRPQDLVLYEQVIFEYKPDYIVETGTCYGGSALFFADMLELSGASGKVITVDINPIEIPIHNRVDCIIGSSIDPAIVSKVKESIQGKVMVVLDSDHSERHVIQEINLYSPMVTVGQFMVVEDCLEYQDRLFGPGKATEAFLKKTDLFVREPIDKQFLIGVTRNGWLKRVK